MCVSVSAVLLFTWRSVTPVRQTSTAARTSCDFAHGLIQTSDLYQPLTLSSLENKPAPTGNHHNQSHDNCPRSTSTLQRNLQRVRDALEHFQTNQRLSLVTGTLGLRKQQAPITSDGGYIKPGRCLTAVARLASNASASAFTRSPSMSLTRTPSGAFKTNVLFACLNAKPPCTPQQSTAAHAIASNNQHVSQHTGK
jgi:hypothetical protein